MVPSSRKDNATTRVALRCVREYKCMLLHLGSPRWQPWSVHDHTCNAEILGQSFNKRLYRSTNSLNFKKRYCYITVTLLLHYYEK